MPLFATPKPLLWPLRSGTYHMPSGTNANSLGTGLAWNGRISAQPFPVATAGTISRIGCEVTLIGDAGPGAVADAVTNGTTTITSATIAFDAAWVGRLVTGTNIPNNTYINSVTNATTAVMTQAASGSGSGGSLTVSGCLLRLGIYADDGNGRPGVLVLDSGVSGTANTNGAAQFANAGAIDGHTVAVQEITVSQVLTPGLYWLASFATGIKTTSPTTENGVVVHPYGFTTIPTGAQVFNGFQDNTSPGVALTNPFTTSAVADAARIPRVFVKAA